MKNLLVISTLMLMMASCSNDDSPSGVSKEIALRPTISSATRTAISSDGTMAFSVGDEFLLYAWDGAASAQSTPWINGVKVTQTAADVWTPATTIYWKSEAVSHEFIAVYPTTIVNIASPFTPQSYTLGDATTSGYSILTDDILMSHRTGVKMPADNTLILPFDHAMAKLNVVLSFRNQWGSVPTVASVVTDMAQQADIDLVSCSVTPSASASRSRQMIPLSFAADDITRSFQLIGVPNDADFKSIVVTIGGQTFTYTSPTAIPLESGKVTTVNLVVGRNTIDLNLGEGEGGEGGEGGSTGITIGDWTDNDSSLSGDAYGD